MYQTYLSRCFLEQETLPSLLSSGWFQEKKGLFQYRNKINWYYKLHVYLQGVLHQIYVHFITQD